ncbi:MAG TPA: GNAT family N-acetyltransferase [Candidatus Acidoferrum sp.]|nr:GNAT family N-acetyltransferase [Candidatus Acidoferrum sp.]
MRLARHSDREPLAQLLHSLWPESTAEDHARELGLILAGKAPGTLPLVIFVAETRDGTLVAFLECGLRSHAESCNPSRPVGYAEGWYVAREHRRKGIGKSLLRAAEEWARSQRCTEIASDAVIDNVLSQKVHQRLGFQEVERSVLFRKELGKADK